MSILFQWRLAICMYNKDILNKMHNKNILVADRKDHWKENWTSFYRVQWIPKKGSSESDLGEKEGYKNIILHVPAVQFPKSLL